MTNEQQAALIRVCDEHKIFPIVIGTIGSDGVVVSLVNGSPKTIVQILKNMLKKHKAKLN